MRAAPTEPLVRPARVGLAKRPVQGVSGVFIERIRISNFKSLKDVEIRPSGLTTLVGPNNAGKTNFVLAMKFLSDISRDGLERAVAQAGGFDSIMRRKARRARDPISFQIDLVLFPETEGPDGLRDVVGGGPTRVLVSYSFGLAARASMGGGRAEFAVVCERLRACVQTEWDRGRGGEVVLYEVCRDCVRGDDQFISHPDTVARFRNVLPSCGLVRREKLRSWLAHKELLVDRAREEAIERMKTPQPFHLPEDKQKELDRIYCRAEESLAG